MDFLNQSKLHQLEELCVQEQPPACMSGCPLHVDGRSICSAAAAGDFDSALAIYKKTVPFPGILSQVCGQHCREHCRRGEAGDPMMIRGLEEAACRYGKEKKPRSFLPKRDHSVGIVGGGISGLTAALELGKKGCRVTVYEKEDQLGGKLLERNIPKGILEQEFSRLRDYPIEIRLQVEIQDLEEVTEKHDAVYVAWGAGGGEGISVPDSSFYTGREKIFAGGYGILEDSYDSAYSMADGKRAAISIDRYLKQVSMTVGREREGVFVSSLYVNMEQVSPVFGKKQSPFTKEEAQEEAKRCLDCKCLECVKECAFLREYKTFPRKYVREVYNNLSIAMGNRHANRMINSCSLCGQCGAVCPHGLDLGMVTKEARQVMTGDGKMPASSFEFGLRDMEYADSKELAMICHQPGMEKSRYLFFPGCQIGASAPEIVVKTYEDLCERLLGGVGLYLGCCGIPADWAGESRLFEEQAARLLETWNRMGNPEVIVACPTCYKVWREQIPEAKVTGIWTVLAEAEEFEPVRNQYRTEKREDAVTVMDACGAREFAEIHTQVRNLLKDLGYQIEEQNHSRRTSGCCGFGGLMPVSNRKLSRTMAASRVENREGYYFTYCMNCRDRYTGAGARAVHLLELFYGKDREQHQPPTWSDRQRRRRWLKKTLLQNLWQEKEEDGEEMTLFYSEKIKEEMEERMILEEDLEETIGQAEQTGSQIRDTKQDCCVAGKRIGNVHFWVYYRKKEEGYEILKAYSHRMNFR